MSSSNSAGSSRRVYVGRIASRTRERDLEDVFSKYGRCRAEMKSGFAFVEFDDERDAEDAIRGLDNTELDGAMIRVEPSHGSRKSSNDECFTCGGRGHWARDCPSARGRGGGGGDRRGGRGDDRRGGGDRGRCYNCGEYGHMARDCRNSRRSPRRDHRSRSRSPRRDHRSRSRSPRRERESPSPRDRHSSPRNSPN
eukprot:TRINITY_DN2051_c0_g1_i1.p1 TRINITY_DN2051_c0_g1~~TRINITY_DN2051_c0_g1_i1.p1  ORF type:complete len:196 (+),score=34.14 TRINITY_DN2051_c0_g1_i1:94-681(+)